MSVEYLYGKDLFTTQDRWLVNPVNVVGVMGAGLAKQFAIRYPEILEPYKHACSVKLLKPGGIYITTTNDERHVMNLATKGHYKDPSKLEYIRDGLVYMEHLINILGLKSISMTDIGCGLGGLSRDVVLPMIESRFKDHPCQVKVYINAR